MVKLFAVTPLTCGVALTATELPVVVKVATSAVTSVPNGTVTAISVPVITPATAGLVKPKAVISLAELAAIVTVTVYDLVVLSTAVTI